VIFIPFPGALPQAKINVRLWRGMYARCYNRLRLFASHVDSATPEITLALPPNDAVPGATESWSPSKNPSLEERGREREQGRHWRARQFVKRERKRDAMSIISATATRTDQAP
jgi:hypothetical protein